MLEIRLLGQYDVQRDGVPIEISSRPAKTLLAYLVLTIGTHHPRERLAGVLWPDSTEANARKNLRQALWQLRKAIGDTHLLVDKTSIAFDAASDFWLDVAVLEDLSEQDRESEVLGYEGELLPGFYEDWILLERDRLQATFERKMQRLLDHLMLNQRWTDALECAEQWIAKGHVPEAAYRALMMAHAATSELSKVESDYQRCSETLMQDIGVAPSEETTDLYKSLLAGEKVLYPDADKPGRIVSPEALQVSLPAELTPFVGRRQELAEIERLLPSTRLLTLSGPGGIGKTRLALKAAANSLDQFSHGVHFVSLAPIRSAEHINQTISEAVKFPLATHESPQHQLLRFLQKKQLLLVMDNFEHLLDGVVIVSEILEAAPEVKILATSREKLNLQGETNLVVGGMGFPELVESIDSGKRDAATLFLLSARRVRPGFDPSPDELEHIENICRIVQGMPLAIELAAAWLHILTVDEIAEELEKGLDILATEMRDAPERHRSIRAVFDHSWSLLHPTEQETFKLLSVFRGGFAREAAQHVAGASLQQLAGMVNKSLLSHDPTSGRFEVHELLRQYAQERLGEAPEASISAQEAHAAYFAAFMQQRGGHLRGKRQKLVLTEIEADIENVRTAWRYYLDRRNTTQLWKFIFGLWHVYYLRWWNHAGMELFAEAARALQGEADEETATLLALAMAFQSWFMAWLDLADEGYKLAEKSVETLQQYKHPEVMFFAYYSMILNAYFTGAITEQSEATNQTSMIATQLNDKWLRAFSLFGAGMIALIQGDLSEAKRIAEWNLELYEEVGDVSGSTMPLIVLGHTALAQGEYKKAREFYLRCLKISQEVGFYFGMQTSSKYLGKVSLSTDKITEAEDHLLLSLRITQEIGFVRDIINLLYEFARLRVAQENIEQAVELLALVIGHPASDQTRWLEGRIGDSAKDLLSLLEGELTPQSYAEALARGQALEYEEVVASLLDGSGS